MYNKFISLICSILFILTITACTQEKPKEQQENTPQTAQQQPDMGTVAPPQSAPVKGKVLETMDAAGYSYMNVETDSGSKWIAVNQTPVEVGEEITYLDGMVMQNFTSKSLDRTFPEIIFSGGLVGKGAVPSTIETPASGETQSFSQALTSETGTAPVAAPVMTTGSQKAIVPLAEVKVEKAPGENSYTVEEIFNQASELNGKTVTVRGKVVKVSPKIMGRNWVHLQDGTGNPENNTHDLVVTTLVEPDADWDIITMEGVLAADKDFGSGYKYTAIIEEASVK